MNNKTLKVAGLIVLIALISFVMVRANMPKESLSGAGSRDDLKSQIMKRGVIRVGYVIYPPSLIKDPNTGKLSGIFYDALNAAGTNLGLKVEWVEEVGWGSMIEGLRAGRYDMIGNPVWSSSARATKAEFTIPLTYSLISAYVRTGDHRFDNDFSAIDSPNVRISVIDGEISGTIAKQQFPSAKITSLPQLASISDSLLNVSTGKADIVFVEPYFANAFLKNNPGKIREAQPGNPIRVNGNTMVVPEGEFAFKSMLDTAIQEELNSGYIEQLVKKYETEKNSFYPIAKPFRIPN